MYRYSCNNVSYTQVLYFKSFGIYHLKKKTNSNRFKISFSMKEIRTSYLEIESFYLLKVFSFFHMTIILFLSLCRYLGFTNIVLHI